MEPYIADIIKNPKVPRLIRYIIVILTISFLEFVFISASFNGVYLIGRIFCIILALLFLIIGVYLIWQIHKN